jgi:HEAT repeat protein
MKATNKAIQTIRKASANGDTAYLIDALRDPAVRPWAAHYLGKGAAIEAIPALLRLLRAQDPKTRSAGARALGQLRASEAVPDLISLAENDPDVGPRSHAVGALGRICDPRATPVLIRCLDAPNWVVRSSAAWALGLYAGESAVPALKSAARRERFLLRTDFKKAIRRIRRRTQKS